MTDGSQTNTFGSVRWLTLVLAIGWAVCFWPARLLQGSEGIYWMSMAAICCLVIGWIVAFLSRLAIFRGPLTVMLVQMMGRLLLILGVVVFVKFRHPELGIKEFFGWLILFYVLSLSTEVAYTKLTDPRRLK